jgi:hypothetical protein
VLKFKKNNSGAKGLMTFERSNYNIYFCFLSLGINFVLLHGKSEKWDVAVNGGTEDKNGLKNRRRARKQSCLGPYHEM